MYTSWYEAYEAIKRFSATFVRIGLFDYKRSIFLGWNFFHKIFQNSSKFNQKHKKKLKFWPIVVDGKLFFGLYSVGWREIHDFLKSTDASRLKVKIDVYWSRSEDIGSKFHLFPLQLLVRSVLPPAHFLCNFQNLISLQLVKLIYGKWLKLIAITNIFKFYELLFLYNPQFFLN